MLKLYDDAGKIIAAPLKGCKGICVENTLATGDGQITFSYPKAGAFAKQIRLEGYVETKAARYVLKQEEPDGTSWTKYTAQLDVEALEGKQYQAGQTWTEQTITAMAQDVLDGTGWKLKACAITKRRTIKQDQACSAWDVLQAMATTFRAVPVFDSKERTVDFLDSETCGEYKGRYFMERLNLRKLSISRNTYDFVTCLYLIGKDGLTAGEDDAGTYIENHQYSDKVKFGTWKDERYTVAASLLEDGRAKLAELSKPYENYEVEVIDLAKMNERYQNVLDYMLGDVVLLVSATEKIREKYRIVRTVEYPQQPEKNAAELANTRLSFAQLQKQEQELAASTASSVAENTANEALENAGVSETVQQIIASMKTEIRDSVETAIKDQYATRREMETTGENANEYTDTAIPKALELYRTAEAQDEATTKAIEAAQVETGKQIQKAATEAQSAGKEAERVRKSLVWLVDKLGYTDEYEAFLETLNAAETAAAEEAAAQSEETPGGE